jgi:lipid A 4'-phosphatase
MKSEKKKILLDVLIPVCLVLGSSIFFWFTELDIKIQQFFYNQDLGWIYKGHAFWDIIYKFGIFPGYMLAVVALVFLSLGYWFQRFLKWRKAAVLMIFVLIIGPGIMVNIVLKDNWGRPRPYEIEQFGGQDQYVVPGAISDAGGKSFPCGHCSIAFYLAIPFLFLRKKYKTAAWLFLFFGTLYGLLVGLARMVAGGHFASDVLWSWGIVWLTGVGGYYLLKMYKNQVPKPAVTKREKRFARFMTVIIGGALPGITVSLLLATPYITKKMYHVPPEKMHDQVLIFHLKDANIDLQHGDTVKINHSINAFGFPNSKIRGKFDVKQDTVSFSYQEMGWFTEVRNNALVCLPLSDEKEAIIHMNKGHFLMDVPADFRAALSVYIEKGEVQLKIPRNFNFDLIIDAPEVKNPEEIDFQPNKYNIQPGKSSVLGIYLKNGKVVLQ